LSEESGSIEDNVPARGTAMWAGTSESDWAPRLWAGTSEGDGATRLGLTGAGVGVRMTSAGLGIDLVMEAPDVVGSVFS
jgi:hypothetical protein